MYRNSFKNIDDELATFFKQAGIKLIYVNLVLRCRCKKKCKRQSRKMINKLKKKIT